MQFCISAFPHEVQTSLERWMTNHHSIPYSLSNISAKNFKKSVDLRWSYSLVCKTMHAVSFFETVFWDTVYLASFLCKFCAFCVYLYILSTWLFVCMKLHTGMQICSVNCLCVLASTSFNNHFCFIILLSRSTVIALFALFHCHVHCFAVWFVMELYGTRNTFYGTRYLSHCYARFAFNPLFINWVTIWPLGSRDVIGHVTIGTAVGHFLLVIHWHHVPISHHCRVIEHQTFRGHDLDPFGSRDVIGYVTIGTADGHFLLVIHWHHVPISHRCQDIKRHNLDNHIAIVNTLETNFGDFLGG